MKPSNSTDRAIIAAALLCLFVALAAKSATNGASAKKSRLAPRSS